MAEELPRLRKVRGGHRGSVKRIISKVNTTLESLTLSGVVTEKAKLDQQKSSLQNKLKVIESLDEEILGLVEEKEIEDEIEQADIFKETLELTINRIEEAAASTKETASTVTVSTNETPLTSASEPVAYQPSDSHPVAPTAASTPRVKLPKLELRKFDGDSSKWTSFWDGFEASIHNNDSLAAIDKFNYLNSLLEGIAAEAIAGLTLSGANYEDAISVLKSRFGNKQQIVNRHMEILLNIDAVTSNHNIGGLRKLHDHVESQIRSLKSLGVPPEHYGALLSSVIMTKLPSDLRLIVSRELGGGDWELEKLLETFRRELEARERASGASATHEQGEPHNARSNKKPHATAAALVASNSGPTCTYCKSAHASRNCRTVTDVAARKEILRRSGRCYACLRRDHISKNCPSRLRCQNCNGKHHISICSPRSREGPDTSAHSRPSTYPRPQSEATGGDTVVYHTSTSTPVLLQTAKALVYDPHRPEHKLWARLMLDSGSQRSYVTTKLKNMLGLHPREQKAVSIKTFGSNEHRIQQVDVVQLGIQVHGEPDLQLSAFAVPLICQPLHSQPINRVMETNTHLQGLRMADSSTGKQDSEVDILIGSDQYWQLVTGEILKAEQGPTAMHTKLGWVLSGPMHMDTEDDSQSTNLVSTHVLKCAAQPVSYQETIQGDLKKFWDLESLGIQAPSVHEEFLEKIAFEGSHYKVHLPWKATHPPLPDNYDLSQKRLRGLLNRLRKEPEVLQEYDSVIREQMKRGIVEVVGSEATTSVGSVHYLPHHAVIRRDKTTTKLRVVFDASAKSEGASLNDCLHAGPVLTQNLTDIMLRFRTHRVALTGDIEKAFLMVRMAESDRDALRFLWVDDVQRPNPSTVTLRFTRVVFGVSASPFLLNATIKHHVEKYKEADPEFVKKFLNAIYVDDLTSGADDTDEAYELYLKSKIRLAAGGFNMRKFATNSAELRERIEKAELATASKVQPASDRTGEESLKPEPGKKANPVEEEDTTYTSSVLGAPLAGDGGSQKTLGTLWDFQNDSFIVDLTETARLAKEARPTKRNVISVASKFYDPLGFISPITVQFKLLFRELCEDKTDWDSPLEGTIKTTWDKLVESLQHVTTMSLPRCYFTGITEQVGSCELHGFCDASARAYGAVVYLRIVTTTGTHVQFVSSKTRVAPLVKQTIPRLELLSALVVARLMDSVKRALESEIDINKSVCWTDSKVAWYWITQDDKEWKQFVQHRVDEIRKLVPLKCWNHCPGKTNPADILSRGIDPKELPSSELWWKGPEWLKGPGRPSMVEEEVMQSPSPEACLVEMKVKDRKALQNEDLAALVVESTSGTLSDLIDCRAYSCLERLLRVTALVMKFVKLLKARIRGEQHGQELTSTDVQKAKVCWIKEAQKTMELKEKFKIWKQQFGLFTDEDGLMRCKGRLENAELPWASKHPMLLDSSHHLATLIVWSSHNRIMHGGVKATLTDVRSNFWIVHGRNFVRRLVFSCVACKKAEGRPYKAPPTPPLPEFRVQKAPPFKYTGVDYVGPLYIKSQGTEEQKVWICLLTCCVTRAVHLEVVQSLTAEAFLRSFRRFAARRSTPSMIVSDNAKTFKAASKDLVTLMQDPRVKRYFSNEGITWSFTLEKAPWQGGFYERLVKSLKRCLKKTVGRALLSLDELTTVIAEAEMTLNSRPLSSISSEDIEEPLTPSHLLCGRRIMSVPDQDSDVPSDGEFTISSDNLGRRLKHLDSVMDHFWKRWKSDYLMELRNAHARIRRTSGSVSVAVGDMVLIHDANHPRAFWQLGRVVQLVASADGQVRGAQVKVQTKGGRSSILRRPVQLLYPIEVRCDQQMDAAEGQQPQQQEAVTTPVRPRRTAAVEGEIRRRRTADEEEH